MLTDHMFNWTHPWPFPASHTTPLFFSSNSLKACPAILLRLITPDICVMMSSDGKFTAKEQTCERCIFYVWFSLCVIQRRGMFWRQRVSQGAGCNVGKENWVHICVCVCVCVSSQSMFEKFRFLSRWLGSSSHSPPHAQFTFWIKNHLLFLS